MSDFLDSMRADFDARLSAHEGMLAHLGLHPSGDDATFLLDELKATMVACGACHCPRTCLDWQDRDEDGPPPWCHRRKTFLTLKDACRALEAEKARQIAAI